MSARSPACCLLDQRHIRGTGTLPIFVDRPQMGDACAHRPLYENPTFEEVASPASVNTTAFIIAYPRSQLRRSTCRARRISESVALRVLCSNCALSPAPQRACRSGRDSQLFSWGGGTPHTRDDSSSQ